MTEEELRLEIAKLAVQCFIVNNNDRKNSFAVNADFLYNFIKYGTLPESESRKLEK